jgi:hypothetical protein
MEEATLAALRGSIEKWRKIVEGTGVDQANENCPLCEMFLDVPSMPVCRGCPVSAKSGLAGCADTPHTSWSAAHAGSYPYRVENEHQRELAQNELDFLISLLPEGTT